jgi:membrane protein insertase Oxa1/YidC/SpoIIIJ
MSEIETFHLLNIPACILTYIAFSDAISILQTYFFHVQQLINEIRKKMS